MSDAPTTGMPPPGTVVLVSGARAAERELFADLETLLGEASDRDLSALARPVLVIVPSRSLRDHLAAELVRRRGRAAAGVAVLTLRALALGVLERAGSVGPVHGGTLFDVLVRRMAREEPALRQGLDGLVDGYAAVSATVRDLLDAGLVPLSPQGDPVLELAEAADEALATDGPALAGSAAVERARALVRTAGRVARAQHLLAVGRTAQLLATAAEVLSADPEAALPARAVLVAGFADATGVASDLLARLLERSGSRLYLDRPPDPGGLPGAHEEGFTERLRRRLELTAGAVEAGESGLDAARIECFEAPGGEAEVLETVRRVRELLDRGARPEGIALVVRDLTGYRLHLPQLLASRGIPFHAPTLKTAPDPAGRLARGLVDLLRRGGDLPVDRWLDLCSPSLFASGPTGRDEDTVLFELRLAFHAQGAGRLSQAAELAAEPLLRELHGGPRGLPLPLFQEISGEDDEPAAAEPGEEEPATGGVRARRRWLDGDVLLAAVAAARGLLDRLAALPETAPAEHWFDELRRLLRRDLGWAVPSERDDGSPATTVQRGLEALRRDVPGALSLERGEITLLAEAALDQVGRRPLPGAGGGVRVLGVTEARGLTFDHLFLLGLNRDLFPRVVREDPLLADDLRRVLQRVLPDTPLKTRGHDEERLLFAQLLSASPHVTLSWQSQDDEGAARAPSPLLARLRWGPDPLPAPDRAAPRYAPPTTGEAGLRPPGEHAVLAGLFGDRSRFERLLPRVEGVGPERGAALLAALGEIEPGFPTPPPGPFFGFVGDLAGTPAAGADPRRRELWVTHLEHVAACPWQAFVQRLLRVEPVPDPLAALPDLGNLLVGQLVHAVLETLAQPVAAGTGPGPRTRRSALDAVLVRTPTLVPWPEDSRLETLLETEAKRLLADEGIGLPGLARPLAARARPYLDAAREALWKTAGTGEDGLPVLGAEVVGSLALGPPSNRRLHFRADLVATGAGGPQLLDFKTGKPVSDGKQAATRERHLAKAVARGERLQAVAYALALEPGRGSGGYLFLRPELEADRRFAGVEGGGGALREPFESATAGVLEVWDHGAFFPRLVDPDSLDEPARCRWCPVAEACVRGDSGARRRLVEGVETWATERAAGALQDPAAEALLTGWWLASRRGGAPEGDP
ncbi:MAG: exodeoxyribonuclease V subunit gamma [Acidobacteria bacterium]|nr:exodeoxyribonuclease V subunit gamma [Acidobacteriota bacterium]